ncbi:MAG: holo-ACP synthase [Candidatus Wallbacteria bacterium]|nr:holo-ACP synthase [Candidatus Wallbacteria bacterium]
MTHPPDTFPTCGIDLVQIARLARSLDRSPEAFAARVFTPAERRRAQSSRDPLRHYAALFSAKEACFKALGLPYDAGFDWQDLDVDPGHARRAPAIVCSGAIARHLGRDRLLLTLAAGRAYVLAYAMRVPPFSPGTPCINRE